MEYPIFNFKPLDDLASHIRAQGSAETKALLEKCLGQDHCCWGNPCYYKGCLACFCRGNIRHLSSDQAYVQTGKILSKEQTECDERISILCNDTQKHWESLQQEGVGWTECVEKISTISKTRWQQKYEDAVLEYNEHLSDDGAWLD